MNLFNILFCVFPSFFAQSCKTFSTSIHLNEYICEMKLISEYIFDLLRNNDCVIVPNLGGFLVKDQPARFSANRSQLIPPSSLVTFSADLKQQDALLMNAILSQEKCSVDEANQKIESFVNEVSQSLVDTKSYYVKRVGKIFVSDKNSIAFQPYAHANFNKNSYSLPTISVQKINVLANDKAKAKQLVKKRPYRFTIAAAALALLLFASLFFINQNQGVNTFSFNYIESIFGKGKSSPEHTDYSLVNGEDDENKSGNSEHSLTNDTRFEEQATSSENPFNEENKISENPFVGVESTNNSIEKENTATNLSENEDLAQENTENNPLSSDNPFNKEENGNKEDNDSVQQSTPKNVDFHVVIGFYEQESNAQKIKQKAEQMGYQPFIRKGRWFYRVLIPFSYEQGSMYQAQQEVNNKVIEGAWIWELR